MTLKRLLYPVPAMLIGFAAGLRACAGLMQAYEIFIGIYAPIAAALMFGAAAFFFMPYIEKNLSKHALTKPVPIIICFVLCAAVYIFSSYKITGFQLEPYPYGSAGITGALHRAGMGIVVFAALLYFLKAISSVFSLSKLRSAFRSIAKKDIIFTAAVFVVLNALMTIFCLKNKTICFWDNAGFWLTSQELADTYRQLGLAELLRQVYYSVFLTDYNYIIALPTTALTLLFGNARMVFILGITNIYLFPLLMLIYVFARGCAKKPCFAATVTFASLPLLFYITKEGYIDVGAVVFAMAALLLWFRNKKDASVERFIVIGVLLVISMILRRWLVFFVISYLAALLADCVFYKKSAAPFIAAVVTIGICLAAFFQPYVTLKLMANYADMYSAYDLGLRRDIIGFTHAFGIITLAAVIIGALALLIKNNSRQSALFLLIQISVCFVVFVHIQSHNQQHLLLYIPAFSCILCMLLGTLSSGKATIPAVILSCAYAAVSVLGVTVFADSTPEEYPTVIADINCMPALQADTDEILRLSEWLDENIGEQGKTAAVLASSLTFNREILINAEASLNVSRKSCADKNEYLLWLPQVDSRDGIFYPIYEADYIVVADPIQLHMDEENQQCIAIPAKTFLEGENIANAYKKLDEEFKLGWDDSVSVYIYEKERPATDEEISEYTEKTAR